MLYMMCLDVWPAIIENNNILRIKYNNRYDSYMHIIFLMTKTIAV